MKNEHLNKEFLSIYDTMAHSADKVNMRIFGEATKKIFEQTADNHPEIAEEWIERLKPITYYNYLSREEADEIIAAIINVDETTAPKWPMPIWENAMNSLGLPIEEKPFFNRCALWVTMNMMYSDLATAIAETIPISDRDLPVLYYRLAVAKLKDVDRKHFIRPYFEME